MGYTTEFYGEFKIEPPVTKEFTAYINAFSDTRHCRWNVEEIKKQIPCWEIFTWKGDLGKDGKYFAMPWQLQNILIQDCCLNMDDPSSDFYIDYNENPVGTPGLWCQWTINNEGNLCWNGNEKFYGYVSWLYYLLRHFFEPAAYKLTGKVRYEGEDPYDRGYILLNRNSLVELPLWVFEMIHENDRTELYKTLEEFIRRQQE